MPNRKRSLYTRFAKGAAWVTGRPIAFALALLSVVIWLGTGPIFHYSDTWQLVINTATTIVTFVMVFLIQNSQNRDTEAIQIKLDELLRATKGAHTALLDLEGLEPEQIAKFRKIYCELADEARRKIAEGKDDRGIPETHDIAVACEPDEQEEKKTPVNGTKVVQER